MGNVVSLPGHPLPLKKGEADLRIVAQLEGLLEEAKGGQIVAFAYAMYRPIDETAHGWTYGVYAFHLAAAIMSLQHEFCELLTEGTESR